MKSLSSLTKINYFTLMLIVFTLLLCISDISSLKNSNKSKNNNRRKRLLDNQASHSIIFSETKLEVPIDLLYKSSSNYGDSSKKLVEQKKIEIGWEQSPNSPLTSNAGKDNSKVTVK